MKMSPTTTCSVTGAPQSLLQPESQQEKLRKLIRNTSFWIAIAACICLGAGNAFAANVKVTCHGSDDTTAINNAITSVNSSGGGIVEIPAGTCASKSIHLKSNVTLQLDANSTIKGHSGIDAPESNAFSSFQDFGHSHFHDALIWGQGLTNIGITGSGTIDGNGVLKTGTPGSGQGDKAISLRECNNVTISGITIKNGGHFGILVNGINTMAVSNVKVKESNQRDGFNLINSQHVTVDGSDIEGSDDAMCLKSDFALGKKVLNTDIHITNSTILSTQNNATQFGSETCGDFTNVSFENLKITAGGKAGIGITSNDGAVIDGVTYNNIVMSGTTAPIWIKLGARGSCPGHPPAGAIRNITLTNVTGTNSKGFHGTITSTISGLPGNRISNITLNNVSLSLPGGRPESDTTINPPETNNWTPSGQGPKPSYGWWLRHAQNVTFNGCSVVLDSGKDDGRPALIADDGQSVFVGTAADKFTYQRGSTSIFDLGFNTETGFCANADSTKGLPARIQNIGSTEVPCP